MGLWHVFYADWQMECCGTPFAVMDEVSWPLLLQDADGVLGGGWHDQLTKLVGPVAEVPDEEGETVRILQEETGLTVALGGEQGAGVGPGDRIRLVGLLTVERHGGAWPEVSGRVRAVQVVTQVYEEMAPGSRSSHPVPGERQLRSVERCPKWFTGGGSDERGRRSVQSGVVATLEVPGTDSWLSYAVR
ncbi:hypothetical protein P2Q00_10395 [Streptomyces coacervatus]|nr:DUF6578 domain-containing protein [Streptomyces coacervatus]MDF2265853.1 hypothetical protein [Streptomyces coacervatus]